MTGQSNTFARGCLETRGGKDNDVPRTASDPAVTGILVLNKPTGITSRKLVDQVARLLPRSKVGHAGTLDPLATGILIVCVGPATRLVENVQDLPKIVSDVDPPGCAQRHARCRWTDRGRGIADDSVVDRDPAGHCFPSRARCIQRPPAYSALKIQGKRAYDLARAGQALELAPRLVRIDRIAVIDYTWPHLELEIDCGGGTYIRSIARDIGEALGCGGYVETLVRTRTGPFTLEQAIDPAALSAESIHGSASARTRRGSLLCRGWCSMPARSRPIVQGKRLSTRDLRGELTMLRRPGRTARLRGDVDCPRRARSRSRDGSNLARSWYDSCAWQHRTSSRAAVSNPENRHDRSK